MATDIKKTKGLLDKLVTEEGFQTDVTITLTDLTIAKIIGMTVVATALSTFTFFTIKSFYNK